MDKVPTTTCQICSREIRAPNGIIAHHGYQRPGDGWQTESCMGARFAPYEVSAARIPYGIEWFATAMDMAQSQLRGMKSNPPAELTYQPSPFVTSRTFSKPENFDTKNKSDHMSPFGYESEFWSRANRLQFEIRSHARSIDYLRKRFQEWHDKHPGQA